MTRIDRYLIRRFLLTYVFAVFIIVLVIMVIDFVEKNDDFLRTNPTNREIIFDYFFNLAPYWANYISPLMIFISTVFFTAKMAAHTEIIAILGTGTSFRRLMRPYFIGSVIVAIYSFIMVGWILPKANVTRIDFQYKYIDTDFYFSGRDIHMAVERNVYAYLSSYDSNSQTVYELTLEKLEDHRLVEKLTANRATYIDSLKTWRVYDYKIRTLGIMKDQIEQQSITPLDTNINMLPSDFTNTKNREETLTIAQLRDYIELINSRGEEGVEKYKIEYYQRFATPFAVIILSLMALIVSARKSRGGVGLQIAIGFLLTFLYIIFYILSKGIAETGNMNPILAVWLPNIVFAFISVIMYFTVPR